MSDMRRIVVKVGSSTLTGAEGGVDRDYVAGLVDQIARAARAGLATSCSSRSGAIAAGVEALGLARAARRHAVAAGGRLRRAGRARSRRTRELFAEHGVPVGQVLLTRHDTGHRESYLHARDTFERLLDTGRGAGRQRERHDRRRRDPLRRQRHARRARGDRWSAPTSSCCSPTSRASTTPTRASRDEAHAARARRRARPTTWSRRPGGPAAASGSGGMATKIEAAQVLMKAGIPMVVCDGRRPERDRRRGRRASRSGRRSRPARATVGGAQALDRARPQRRGRRSSIDDGARDALVERGKSLAAGRCRRA